jgi:hypothetical protein
VNEVSVSGAIEPSEWFVVFHTKSHNRFLSFLAFGPLKHVSAFGYCHTVKVWLLYDVKWSGTKITLITAEQAMQWSRDCSVLKIARQPEPMEYSSRLLFTCVGAIKHLLGLRCVAVTPGGLYREIIARGGTVISEHPGYPAPAG